MQKHNYVDKFIRAFCVICVVKYGLMHIVCALIKLPCMQDEQLGPVQTGRTTRDPSGFVCSHVELEK